MIFLNKVLYSSGEKVVEQEVRKESFTQKKTKKKGCRTFKHVIFILIK